MGIQKNTKLIKKRTLVILFITFLIIFACSLGSGLSGSNNKLFHQILGNSKTNEEQIAEKLPENFKVPLKDWRKATLRVNLIDIDGGERDFFYTLLVPPGISIETEAETETDYLKYTATDGYEYIIYPSDISITNIVGPVYDDVDKWDSITEKIGNYTWESNKILFKDEEMVWYLNTLIDDVRYSFEISIPRKDRPDYVNLISKIISTFSTYSN